MRIISRIKTLVTRTPFIKIVHFIQLSILKKRLAKLDTQTLKLKPVIGLSPYKTGTTYIESCYDKGVSSNDALHHYSLKYGPENFEEFFVQRFNYLNLKLDCTGFWCGYIKELSEHHIAKELNYVYVIRKPSDWVKSTINYFNFNQKNLYFNFINEYFWKQRIGIDVINFYNFDNSRQSHVIEQLITFYFRILKETKLLKNVHYVKLSNIDNIFPVLDSLIDEKANLNKAFKRETSEQHKKFEYKNEKVDAAYEKLLDQLGITHKLIAT